MKKILLSIVSILVLCIVIIAVNFFIFQKNSKVISKGKPILKGNTIKQSLLVIDIQEGLTGKLATSDEYLVKSDELITNVNQIIDSLVRKDIPVIYVKNEISNFLINILNSSLAKGSPGAELDSRLNVVSNYVINKDRGDAFSNPLLDSILIKKEINKLVFVGLDLAYCVNRTIEAAHNRNYDICIISDAVLSKSDSLKNEMLNKFKQSGYEIISSRKYLDKISYD
jgi:nicotinamidase-related amidase